MSAGPSAPPWFAVTMTVRNNEATIGRSLASILPELDAGGELAIVDAVSTDRTRDEIVRASHGDPRVHLVSEPCNRGQGRNRAIELTTSPIVLTQLDADNEYRTGVLRSAAARLRDAAGERALNAVARDEPNPYSTRFFTWRRATLQRLGGYPNVQVAEELGLVLRAYRAGVPFDRFVVARIADDLKTRDPGHGSHRPPWRRSRTTIRAAKKFAVLGYSYGEFARYLGMTRRTSSRYAAGLALAAVGYLSYVASGRSDRFLNDGQGETAADVARSVTSPDWPRRS